MNRRQKSPRAIEDALVDVLAPLTAYARASGLSQRGFSRLAAQAFRTVRPITTRGSAGTVEVGLRLAGRWLSDPKYNRAGKPRRIPFSGRVSFTALARAVRAGQATRLLAALRRCGVVDVDRKGLIALRHLGYVPTAGTSQQMEVFRRAGAEFLKLLTHYLTVPPEKLLLQRAASYDNIGSDGLMTLRTRLREEGLQALLRANTALAASDRDRNRRAAAGQRMRVTFGVYCFEEPVAALRRGKR